MKIKSNATSIYQMHEIVLLPGENVLTQEQADLLLSEAGFVKDLEAGLFEGFPVKSKSEQKK